MSRLPGAATGDLLDDGEILCICEGAWLLRGLASTNAPRLLEAVSGVIAKAPLRHMLTPGGRSMSVAMSNCGDLGWVTDHRGYRYEPHDPQSGRPWPAIPESILRLSRDAATQAGYAGFTPDACLINRYVPGARMAPHQDRDELDFAAPIVSISLGLPATFMFGGPRRKDPLRRITLENGDVVVWGGPARKHFHGVAPIKDSEHPLTGECRFNLTLRKAR